MGITRERRQDSQLKIMESGKTNGRDGKTLHGKGNLHLVDVLGGKCTRDKKERAAPSHVIEKGKRKTTLSNPGEEWRATESYRDTQHGTGKET